MAVAAVSFSDATAAQDLANLANSMIANWTFTGTTNIDGGQIRTDTVTAAQIIAGAIGTSELAANAVTAAKIAAGTITSNEIAANTITAADIAANTITAASGVIANAAITNAMIANITADKIQTGTLGAQTITIGSGGAVQSSNYSSGTAGYKISSTGVEMNDSGSTIKADAIKAGTLGGSGGSGVIQVAAGTSLILNGGYLKSNTYTGTSQATNPSGAGFYLGNDGLRVDSGIISASALTAGTISGTNTITLSGANAKIVGGTWSLSGSGLTIPNGGIAAAALNIQTGSNLMPPAYADFEFQPSYYTGKLATTSATATVVSTQQRFNSQSLSYSPTNATNSVYLGASSTDYNIIVSPSTSYLVSYYAMVATGDTVATVTPTLTYATATTPGTLAGTGTSTPANSTWARYTSVVAVPATATGPSILSFKTNTATGTVFIDGIQIEQKLSNSSTASTWTPPGATFIAGDMIKTGSIQSTATTVVNSVTIPVWSIPLNGSASFANVQVRGNAVVGVNNDDDGGFSQIASGNYSAGDAGWVIRSDGYAEFRNMASDSIDGGAIRTKTLSVDTLTSGTLSDEIGLGSGTSLIATGLMGETVGLGDYGFLVTGPQQNVVTFRASSANTRTLTTSVPHNFVATDVDGTPGSKIRVSIGSTDYDTPPGSAYYVDDVPTTTTFTYTASTSLTESTTAVTNGVVQGSNPDLISSSPVYISFPTDGTQPNIISGQLTADQVTVTQGMSIRLSSQIEQGAVLTINSVIQPPSAGPAMSQSYSGVSFQLPTSGYITGIARSTNGNHLCPVGGYSGKECWVNEYDANGKKVAER
ncbi:MAG TPA: hypothetical protein VN039_17260, partial [Nitrospira sp.]|nr:hypothetical protein [Nitrospira sp.]